MNRLKELKVSNTTYHLGDTPRVYQPSAHASATSNATGYHLIQVQSTAAWMLSFTIRLYQGYVFRDITISGYNYATTSGWYQFKALQLSSGDSIKIIHGHLAGDKNSCMLAIPAGNYYGIDIINVTNGFTQIPEADLRNLFKITTVSTLPGSFVQIQEVTPTRQLISTDISISQTVTSSTANAYEIGSITINGVSTKLYGKDTNTTYDLVGARGTTGLIKNGSSITNTTGLTACPIISGVPYYKESSGSVSQVQADWNVSDTSSAAYIKNKPTGMRTVGTLTVNGWSGQSTWSGGADMTISVVPGDGVIPTAKLADLCVTTAKIASSAVTSAKLASNAVTTAKITNGNVTNAKLQHSSMTLNGSSVSLGGTATLPCIMNMSGTNYEIRINGSNTLTGYWEIQFNRGGTWITFGYIASDPSSVNRVMVDDSSYYTPGVSEYVLSEDLTNNIASGRLAISNLLPSQKNYPDARLSISTPAVDIKGYPNLIGNVISDLRSYDFVIFGPSSSELTAIQKAGGYVSTDIIVDIRSRTATVRVNTQSDIK